MPCGSEKTVILKRFIVAYIAYLILSAAIARRVLGWLERLIGASGVHQISWFLLAGAAGLFLFLVRKNRVSPSRLLMAALSFAGIVLFLKGMRVPEERVHIFQYGLLGFLVATACRERGWKQAVGAALLVVFLVSGADELFQAFLPDRVGDIRDVGFGCLGGGWGAFLSALLRKKSSRNPA